MKIMLKDVLKEMRECKQLKQSEVAEYVGVTAQTYMKWENGKNEPKASDIKKLAEILGVTESEICRGHTFNSDVNELAFMKRTANIMRRIDDVTFTSILYEHIQDKQRFLEKLNNELPSKDEIIEKYFEEQERLQELGESQPELSDYYAEMAALKQTEQDEIEFQVISQNATEDDKH